MWRSTGQDWNSLLAMKCTRRGQDATSTWTSSQLWWLQARITPPSSGTFSIPSMDRSLTFSKFIRSVFLKTA